MLYDTMKTEFLMLLTLYGTAALLCALCFVRFMHISMPFKSIRALAWLCALMSAVFTVCFVRVTAPYTRTSHLLMAVLLLFLAAAAVALIICVRYYIIEKRAFGRFRPFDILNYINDYVIVFDRNNETVFCSCPQALASKITRSGDVDYEIDFNGRCYAVFFSPVQKRETVIGSVAVMNDISSEKAQTSLLVDQIHKLSEINDRLLKEINLDDSALFAEKSRELSDKLQKEIDEKLSLVLMQMEKSKAVLEPEQRLKHLSLLADNLRAVLADIRKIVYRR